MKGQRFYGVYSVFNPKLIVLQIITMQFLFYSCFSFLVLLFNFTFSLRLSMGQFFHQNMFSTETLYGFIALTSYGLMIPMIILFQIIVVEKANKVLDFTFTVFFIHFVISIFYNSTLFLNLGWFMINGITLVISVIMGEYICLKFEQREISLFENILGLSKGKDAKELKKKEADPSDSHIIELNDIKHT